MGPSGGVLGRGGGLGRRQRAGRRQMGSGLDGLGSDGVSRNGV